MVSLRAENHTYLVLTLYLKVRLLHDYKTCLKEEHGITYSDIARHLKSPYEVLLPNSGDLARFTLWTLLDDVTSSSLVLCCPQALAFSYNRSSLLTDSPSEFSMAIFFNQDCAMNMLHTQLSACCGIHFKLVLLGHFIWDYLKSYFGSQYCFQLCIYCCRPEHNAHAYYTASI